MTPHERATAIAVADKMTHRSTGFENAKMPVVARPAFAENAASAPSFALTAVDASTRESLRRHGLRNSMRRRSWLLPRMLAFADIFGLAFAFAIAEATYKGSNKYPADHLGVIPQYILFAAVLPLWLVAAKAYGLYDRDDSRADHSTTDDVVRVFHLVTILAWLLVAGAYETHLASPGFTKVLVFWASAILAITFFRAGARAICRRPFVYLQNTLIVGAGDVGQLLALKVLGIPSTASTLSDSSTNSRRRLCRGSRASRSSAHPITLRRSPAHSTWSGSSSRSRTTRSIAPPISFACCATSTCR